MKHSKLIAILLSVLFLGSTMLVSCGGGGGDGEDEADPLNIVATWLLQPVGYEGISPITMEITAHRAPDDIDATATPGAGDPNYITGITVTTTFDPGVVSPRYLTIVITFNDGLVLTLTGSVNANNTSMSGDYTDTSGSSDTWSAARQ